MNALLQNNNDKIFFDNKSLTWKESRKNACFKGGNFSQKQQSVPGPLSGGSFCLLFLARQYLKMHLKWKTLRDRQSICWDIKFNAEIFLVTPMFLLLSILRVKLSLSSCHKMLIIWEPRTISGKNVFSRERVDFRVTKTMLSS